MAAPQVLTESDEKSVPRGVHSMSIVELKGAAASRVVTALMQAAPEVLTPRERIGCI
jgi:hypothetical protein